MAVKSFSGEDVPRSYRQGLEYNETLAGRSAQNELGWSAHVNTVGDEILIVIRDRNGQTLNGLAVTGTLRHPASLSNDQLLKFKQDIDGVYRATVFGLRGKWQLNAVAVANEIDFAFEYDLWLN